MGEWKSGEWNCGEGSGRSIVCIFCKVLEKDIGKDERDKAIEGKAFCKYAILLCPGPTGPLEMDVGMAPPCLACPSSGIEIGVIYASLGCRKSVDQDLGRWY